VPSFASLGVPADLVDVLDSQGIQAPFPIQAATLADALAGHDVSGRAPTGSGKTLAFGLAMVATAPKAQPKRPTALVLVPTRELAAQVAKVIEPLARTRGLKTATVYGGTSYVPQRRALHNGVDILVACPGRLEDLIEQRDLRLDDVRIAVVDEADRMADMGFLPAVKRLLDKTHADRQTLLFSATLDGDVDVLVKRYQRSPRRHEVATSEEKQGDVSHHFWRVERNDRVRMTKQLIENHTPVIVFCRTRHGADRLAKQLSQLGVDAAPIHGSRTQPQRDHALWQFQTGRVRALIATDVAARGIHVDNVNCVVHYDPPSTDKDYVHRSGRTGRAGADGTVVSLVGRETFKDVRIIQKQLKLPQRVDAPNLGALPKTEWTPTLAPRDPVATPGVERARVRRPQNPNKPWRGNKKPYKAGAGRGATASGAPKRRRSRPSQGGRPQH
jgi:superfamily II DNA/RNA helicase